MILNCQPQGTNYPNRAHSLTRDSPHLEAISNEDVEPRSRLHHVHIDSHAMLRDDHIPRISEDNGHSADRKTTGEMRIPVVCDV